MPGSTYNIEVASGEGEGTLISDCVRLRNLAFYGYHGPFGAEKELGQRLEVDIELRTNLEKAARSDEPEFSTNYAEVYALVREVIEENNYCLLESIAQNIVNRILNQFEVEAARVLVRKPLAPIGGLLDAVEVEIYREHLKK